MVPPRHPAFSKLLRKILANPASYACRKACLHVRNRLKRRRIKECGVGAILLRFDMHSVWFILAFEIDQERNVTSFDIQLGAYIDECKQRGSQDIPLLRTNTDSTILI